MFALDLIHQIWQQILKYKLRSFLAVFGVLWGTFSIIMLMALSQGFSAYQRHQLESVASNFVMFYLWPTKLSFHGYPAGRTAKIATQQIMRLKNTMPAVKAITPLVASPSQYLIEATNHTAQSTLIGISSTYSSIFGMQLEPEGRQLNKLDIKNLASVAIISDSVKQVLFPHGSAVGHQLMINRVPFEVIGVVNANKNKASSSMWYGNHIFLPYTSYEKLFGRQYPNRFALSTTSLEDIPGVVQSVKNYFALHYGISPNDKQGLGYFDSTMLLGFVNWFFGLIEVFFFICGALTLAVGAVGVANIMFLIVNQRSKEIGVRIALGAKTYHIIFQVLLETSLLVLLGGGLGFLLSVVTLFVLHWVHLPDWLGHPTLTWLTSVVAVSLLCTIAMLAGYFPARKAALLNPVDAINKRS